jgi:hypothetical protein
VAVTVQRQEPFVVLDEKDTIVGVGSAASSQFGPLLGSVLWDCFPGSEALFKPYYDAARNSGEPVQFVQYYDGHVARITATLVDEGLAISWEGLAYLDTTTFASFRRTLVESLELLASESSSVARDQARHALRVIEGGAA